MTAYDDTHSQAFFDESDEDSRLLAETLTALTHQIAKALDCSACCVYEYLP